MNTIVKNGKQHIVLIIGIVGLTIAGLALGWTAIVNLAAPPAKASPIPVAKCTSSNVYYATRAPKGSNDFGPNQNYHDVATATKRFISKMDSCGGDSLFSATTVAFAQQGFKLNAATVEANASHFQADKATWQQATNAFKSNVASYTVKYDPRDYQTLGMVPHGESQPSLIRADENVEVGWALYVHMKDGRVLEFRIICDMQEVGHFPNVPSSKHPVPPSSHHTPTCTELGTCTPPSSTPPTHTKTTPPTHGCSYYGTCHTAPPSSTPPTTTPPSSCVPTPGVESCGKHASYAPSPTGGPVVQPSSGGYVDRSGGVHSSAYVPPSNDNPNPGQSSAGDGATNTTTAPSASYTAPAPQPTETNTGTVPEQ